MIAGEWKKYAVWSFPIGIDEASCAVPGIKKKQINNWTQRGIVKPEKIFGRNYYSLDDLLFFHLMTCVFNTPPSRVRKIVDNLDYKHPDEVEEWAKSLPVSSIMVIDDNLIMKTIICRLIIKANNDY